MIEPITEKLGLPPADQIGLVVKNLESAMEMYGPLFGPFTVVEGTVEGAEYRGRTADCHLKCAFGRTGDLEVELVEWVSGHSPHRDTLERGQEGLQHIRFAVNDIDSWVTRAGALGYRPIWRKRWSPELSFCYLERDDDPVMLEFVELTPG